MKFLCLFLVFLCNSTALLAQSICKDRESIHLAEQAGYSRLFNSASLTGASTNFDVSYYRCNWEVNPSSRYIAGSVTIYFRMTAAAASVTLDLVNGFIIDSIRQRNNPLSSVYNANTLQINFPAPIPQGTIDSVSIYYRGIPGNTGFGSFIQTQHAGIPVIWTLSEPYGSRDWWPCKNGLDDKADSIDIFITTPVAYKAASNGILQMESIGAGGTKKTAWWKHRYPIASYLVCFAVTNYTVLNHSVQLGSTLLPVQTYCYPESQGAFQSNTINVLNAMKLFHNRVGDYPFIREKYGHVQFSWGGGMEHQTNSFIVNTDESLMAHELAHQWFGDKITCGSWEDIWLNEGFATHLASMYMEEKYPANAIQNRKNEIADITAVPGGSVRVDDTSNVGRIFDWRLSYLKGSHLIYMLRWIMGDLKFFTAIKEYMADPELAYRYARTDDLRRHLEKQAGRELGYFFTQWFSGQGYPSYEIEWSQLGTDHVKIRVNQQSSHSSVPFFRLPLPLLFKNATQQATLVLDHTSNGEVFIRSLGFIPDTVLVDPESWLISRNNRSKKIMDISTGQPQLELFPNPVKDHCYLWLRNFTESMAAIRVYNGAGQLMYSRNTGFINGSQFLEIPTQSLAAGVYYLQVSTASGIRLSTKFLR